LFTKREKRWLNVEKKLKRKKLKEEKEEEDSNLLNSLLIKRPF
tara:strand:- start:78 stop:206 length:129 start_codon:yes stop_codon:yes gene_type:complete